MIKSWKVELKAEIQSAGGWNEDTLAECIRTTFIREMGSGTSIISVSVSPTHD